VNRFATYRNQGRKVKDPCRSERTALKKRGSSRWDTVGEKEPRTRTKEEGSRGGERDENSVSQKVRGGTSYSSVEASAGNPVLPIPPKGGRPTGGRADQGKSLGRKRFLLGEYSSGVQASLGRYGFCSEKEEGSQHPPSGSGKGVV